MEEGQDPDHRYHPQLYLINDLKLDLTSLIQL